LWYTPESVFTQTIPLPAGGGVVVPAEVFAGVVLAGFAAAGVLAAGAAVDELAAGFAAGAGADEAAGVAAGAADDPGAAVSVVAFFDRVFFVVAAESLAPAAVESDLAVVESASAAAFFDRVFLVVAVESLAPAASLPVSAAAFFVFFAVVVVALEASLPAFAAVFFVFFAVVVVALEASLPVSAAAFFVFFAVVVVALDASLLASAAAFFVFFLVVLAALSAVESLDASCARSCVLNRNKPSSAATASSKPLVPLIFFIMTPPCRKSLRLRISCVWGSWTGYSPGFGSLPVIAARFVSAWGETQLASDRLPVELSRVKTATILRGLYCGIYADSTSIHPYSYPPAADPRRHCRPPIRLVQPSTKQLRSPSPKI
jgi:hypothetical protein